MVSVPSRGLCFQSDMKMLTKWMCSESFRPLSGIMFSICVEVDEKFNMVGFPSPLGDYVFNQLLFII